MKLWLFVNCRWFTYGTRSTSDKGAALQTGRTYALRAGADIAVHFDADGQHDWRQIDRLLAPILDGSADVVFGSRFLRKVDAAQVPFMKRMLLRGGILVSWLLSGVRLSDTHNGFRALSRRALEQVRLQENGFAHATEILQRVRESRLRLVEVPITVSYTDYSIQKGQRISNFIKLVAAHPLAFARHLLGMVHSNYRVELRQLVGAFGWTKFTLRGWTTLLYLLLLVLVAATEFSTKPFLVWERVVLLLVFLAGVVFVHAAMAVSDTTLCGGNLGGLCFDSYTGVQGRNLIPFCLAGFLTLRQNRVNLPQVTLLALVTGAGTLHALAALALIRSNFYL